MDNFELHHEAMQLADGRHSAYMLAKMLLIESKEREKLAAHVERASEIEPAQTVTITREGYDQLKGAAVMLGALEAAGVTSWSGYGFAMNKL